MPPPLVSKDGHCWAAPQAQDSCEWGEQSITFSFYSNLQNNLQTPNKSLFSSLNNWFFMFGITGASEGGSSSAGQSSMLLLTDTGVPFFCLFHLNFTYLTCAQTVIHPLILFHRLAAQSFCLLNWAMKSLNTKALYLVASLKWCWIPSYLFHTISPRHQDKFEFSTLSSPRLRVISVRLPSIQCQLDSTPSHLFHQLRKPITGIWINPHFHPLKRHIRDRQSLMKVKLYQIYCSS